MLTTKQHNDIIDMVLSGLNTKPYDYIDTFKFIRDNPLVAEIDGKTLESKLCHASNMVALTKLADKHTQMIGMCESQRLRITEEGRRIINDYSSYSQYFRYNRNKTQIDVFKVKYFWVISGSSILMGFFADTILEWIISIL